MVRLVLAIVVVAVSVWVASVRADNARVTLHGRLTATAEEADEGSFTLDADEIGVITINPGNADYIRDFLKGSVGSEFTVTLGPTP